jgi:hypothetical protein
MSNGSVSSAIQNKDRLAAIKLSSGRRQASHLYLPLLGATPQQKDEKKNWNRNSEQPQQNVACRASLLNFFLQCHKLFPPDKESDQAELMIVSNVGVELRSVLCAE